MRCTQSTFDVHMRCSYRSHPEFFPLDKLHSSRYRKHEVCDVMSST
ncbi:hypothetical protein LG3211_3930 [Lysobacter gummosus]|nr:hypothetical protein LG3211_3930 [Lysobacter gummosus]